MQIAIQINLDAGETLHQAVKALLAMPDDAEVVAPANETEPKRRTRKAKEEAAEAIVETVKEVLADSKQTAAPNVETVEQPNAPLPTFDDVRKATTRLAEVCGLDVAKKLRDEFNVKKINDIPEVEWFNFIQKAEQLIGNKETEVA